jgi:transcriptional regulator with XRE-family HTH domain
MPEAKHITLDLKNLRRIARLSGHDLARVSGVAPKNIYDLERGVGNPRFTTLHRIVLALSFELGEMPSVTYTRIISDETFAEVQEIYRNSHTHRTDPDRRVRFRSPRSLGEAPTLTSEHTTRSVLEGGMHLARVKSLYAESGYSIVDVGALTGMTTRRLNDVLGLNSTLQQDLLYWSVLRLAAVFAPFLDGDLRRTLLHMLEDDLSELDQLYAEREKELLDLR